MSAPKYSAEFKEQVVPRDRSTIPAGGRVAGACSVVCVSLR